MKFNINDYKGKYVMHCKTEKEAIDFCNYLHNIGKRWNNIESYANNTEWSKYTTDTVYFFNSDLISYVDYAKRNNYTILEWSDFMNNKFTKADLRTGDIIKRESGDVEIVIKELNVLVRRKDFNTLDSFNEDLTHSFLRNEDIIAVRRPTNPSACQFDAFKEERGVLIYERKEQKQEHKEVEEMTLAEVCKLLGKEIKIIK